MPMMKQLRDSTKIIMILVAVSFVGLMVFEWGMELSGSTSRGSSGSALGSVNGADISVEEYQRQYQILYEQAQRSDPDGQLSAEDLQQIEDAAWDEVVNITLLQQEARRRDIRITDRELVEFIKNNPPSELVELPAFQTEGQFDLAKYQQALGDPALAETWAEYERQLRVRLPINKLQEQVIAGIEVTDLEILERFAEQNERARIAYVYLDPDRLVPPDRVRVTDEDIRQYYEANKDAFRRDESATIRYATFRPSITAADSARSRAQADSLARVAREPDMDFGALARRFSDDRSSADSGGDLGWIAPTRMHPAFAAAVADLEPREVSDPVLTPFGWHVIRLEARSEEEGEPRINVRQIVIAIEPSPEARQQARQLAQTFARAAAENAESFDRAAGEQGLEVRPPVTFEKGVVVPGLGVAPAVSEFAFANPAGSLSGPIEQDGSFHVVRIDARYPAGTVALAQVSDAIRERLVREKQVAAVRGMSEEIVEAARSGGLEGAAARFGLEVQTSPWFTRLNNIPGIGSGTPVAGAAFGLVAGQSAGPIETERGLFLIRVLEKEPINQSQFEQARPALANEVRTEKMRAAIRAWFDGLKETAEIEDNRNELLGGVRGT
jgi:peptidyl-prolyl cis-trans isomerase D